MTAPDPKFPVLYLDLIEREPKTLEEFGDDVDEPYDDVDALKAAYRQYRDRFQPFRLVLKSAGNNEPLMWGESYFHREDALSTAHLVGSWETTVFLREAEHGNVLLRQAVRGDQ